MGSNFNDFNFDDLDKILGGDEPSLKGQGGEKIPRTAQGKGKGSPAKGTQGNGKNHQRNNTTKGSNSSKRTEGGKQTSKGSSKKKKKAMDSVALDKPSAGKIVGAVFTGLLFTGVLSLGVYGGYLNFIRYPKSITVTEENTGMYCLKNYESDLKAMKSTGEGSYISQEIKYANGDEKKLDFYKKMLGTVSYEPYTLEGMNVYGNTLVNRKDEVVYDNSSVGEGEDVKMSYIDYSRVQMDRNLISVLMEENDLKVGDVDYPNKLVNVFCEYMSGLNAKKIPLKTVRRVPYMIKNGDKYDITNEEDIYIDRLLFSSKDLYDCMDRFAAVASSIGVKNPEWEEWNKKSEEEKATLEEPDRELQEISPTEEWLEWDKLSTAEKAEVEEIPVKYDWKQMVDQSWCGTFYLQNEYTTKDKDGNTIRKKISAEVGDGTIENPAGLDTDVVTSIFQIEYEDDKPVEKEYPIRVRMTDFGVSEDAIKWFEDQDVRNRGLDVTSEVQYVYYTFEVTNLSDKELTIFDNSSLADKNANVASRTGVMYGITEEVTLKPDETAVIESWSRSTELNKRYVIWGADFARRAEPVWFRVLAGDIDDPSEDKGVTINKTRHEEEEEDN